MREQPAWFYWRSTCGCSFNTAKAADQWPLRYSKEGGTYQQLNEDGGGCLSGATQAMRVVTILTLGLATPFLVKRNRFSPRPVLRVIWLSEHREPGRTKYEIDHRQNVLRIRREFKLLRELQ